MKFGALLFMVWLAFGVGKKYVPYPECDFCEVYHNLDDSEEWGPGPGKNAAATTTLHDQIFFIYFIFIEEWEEHYRNYHQNPGDGQRFTPNTSDEDTVDISSDDDEPQPEMVLLPDNTDEFDAGADNHVHSTPLNSPPPSPDVIEVVAVDRTRRRNPVTHHPPLGGAKAPRKRPAPVEPTESSSKSKKVCFKKVLMESQVLVSHGMSIFDI